MKITIKTKGGPGSGNWAHIGRQGVVGGSASRDSGMSISRGSDWLERYEAKAGHSHPFKVVIEKDREEARKKAEAEARKNRIPINEDTKAEVEKYVRRNYSLKELEIAMNTLEEMTAGKPVSIRVPSEILIDYILPQGKFKNQHETGTSKGTLDPKRRVEAERNGFGNDLRKPEDFPIYGYIDSKLGNADHYGDVRVVFNPAVRRRTTITVGDSLDNLENRHVVPSPIDKLGIECFDTNINGSTGKFYGRYIEAQIHGGLTLADIDFIDLSHVNAYHKNSIISMLDARGIRYTE